MSKWVKAWHFMADRDGKPTLRGGLAVPAVGEILKHEGKVVVCLSGLHASKRIIDALKHAPGPWCALVEVRGIGGRESDKVVARERRILKIINAERVLWRFACDVAARALELENISDERSWTAITARLGHMDGLVSDDDLSEAWGALRDKAGASCAVASAVSESAVSSAVRSADLAARSAVLVEESAQNIHLTRLMLTAMNAPKGKS